VTTAGLGSEQSNNQRPASTAAAKVAKGPYRKKKSQKNSEERKERKGMG